MASDTEHKKVTAVRTFADDMKRVGGTTPAATIAPEPHAETPPPPTPSVDEVATQPSPSPTPASTSTAQQQTSEDIAEPEYQNEFGETVELSNDPVEIPPFHSIRASSASDTTYTDEESIHIDSKEALKSETVRKTTPPKPITISSNDIAVDLDTINEQKASVHSSSGAVFETEDALTGTGEGTIVSDKRRKRFRLFPAIFKSLSGWANEKQEEIKDARRPEHVVEKSERRSAIIQSAGAQTKQAPKDDYENVSERLRSVERTTTSNTEMVIRDKVEATPAWSYTTSEESLDDMSSSNVKTAFKLDSHSETADPETTTALEEDTDSHVIEEETPVETNTAAATPDVRDVEESNEAPLAPETDDTMRWGSEDISNTQDETGFASTVADERPIETPADAPTTVEEQSGPVAFGENLGNRMSPVIETDSGGFAAYREKYGEDYAPREEAFMAGESLPPATENVSEDTVSRPKLQRQGVPEYRLDRVGQPKHHQATGVPLITMIAVIATAVILGVGSTVWWFTRTIPTDNQVTPVSQSTILKSDVRMGVELTSSRSSFYDSLRNAIQEHPNSTTEIFATTENVPASTADVLSVLNWLTPSSFTRSINTITFGSNTESTPFIVLTFSSFDTVFAGMLIWEEDILTDLTPLFTGRAYDHSIDSRVNNRDIRVLVDKTGDDVLVYGFTDKNTLIITTNRNTFSTVASKVR